VRLQRSGQRIERPPLIVIGAPSYRNGPDVPANANFSFHACADQATRTANEYGGTRFAAPMWPAFIALVDLQLAANGSAGVGKFDATVYPRNESGSYSAVPVYDLVTGWTGQFRSGFPRFQRTFYIWDTAR
jgi:hypothetical protein